MSLETHIDSTVPLTVGGKTITVRRVSLRQLFRLLALVDKVKKDLGITKEELEKTTLDAAGVTNLVGRIFSACIGTIDFGSGEYELTGTAKVVCDELGMLVGVSGENLADADLDEVYAAVMKFWEVNASGPLGRKIQDIIDGLVPMMSLAKDVVMTGFQKELIKGLRNGGTDVGGMTGYSSPSFESSPDGLNDTSSTTSPLDEFLSSQPQSDSTPDSKEQSSEPLTESPESPAPEAPQIVDLGLPMEPQSET